MSQHWNRFKPRRTLDDVAAALRGVVETAERNVPFYRNAWQREGIRAAAIRTPSDLSKLPVTRRADLMASGSSGFLHASQRERSLYIRHTTGTTGEPVIVHLSRAENLFRRLTLLDAFHRYIRFRLPMTLIDVGPESKDRSTRTEHWAGPIKVVRLFRGMPLGEQIDRLLQAGPGVLEGRPTPLWELAQALQERGTRPPRPRQIFSYAEMLYPHVRHLLEETFAAPVADLYNCEEVGNVAWECPDHPGTMHPNTATCWLEAVDSAGRPLPYGQTGRILVTNLYNHTMPFIRYEMGDVGAILEPGTCSCGFRGPRMRLTEGRNENFFVLPDGREITPRLAYDAVNSALPHDDPDWSHVRSMRSFQIIQEAVDLIIVRVIPGPAYSAGLWPPVQERLKELHPSMRLEIEIVDDLSAGPGGKFHQVVGRLNSRWSNEMNAECELRPRS